MMINVFVVHYKPLAERYKNISDLLRTVDLISSVSYMTREPNPSDFFCSPFDIAKSFYPPDYVPRELRPSELSVFVKHVDALRFISGLTYSDSHSIILEDDVIVDPAKLKAFIRNLIACSYSSMYDLLFFGTGAHIPPSSSSPCESIIVPTHTYHKSKCADSYAITPNAAKKILASHAKLPLFMPYDWDMNLRINHLDLRVGWLHPGITVQGSQNGIYQSSIQNI